MKCSEYTVRGTTLQESNLIGKVMKIKVQYLVSILWSVRCNALFRPGPYLCGARPDFGIPHHTNQAQAEIRRSNERTISVGYDADHHSVCFVL